MNTKRMVEFTTKLIVPGVISACICHLFLNLGMTCIDLNKELAANDLSLTFEDVHQIICILYCVGTVDISPQKVASLRLIAQVTIRNNKKCY